MAEPTDINKNKSAVSAMMDALRIELKELQRFKTVDPEVLGGKAGKRIPVPKKFTADQIVSFMKRFPKMFPLANENAYFGIARALTIKSPDLFDIPSFEEYEKKYGDVMEMQEKGGLASKYIATAKESTPANDPKPTGKAMTKTLTEIEFVEKLKAGTATVEEAVDFAQSRPTVSKNAKKRINALKSGFKKMGLDITMPYKDLKDEATLKLFTREGSPDKSNRAGNLQALENNVRDLFDKYAISGLTEKVPGSDLSLAMYPQLTGAGTVAGTQRTGLALERPMRGNFLMEDFVKIYAEAIPAIEQEYGQATADLIRYHATTANRPEQLQGLKKSDVTISGNQITVTGKTVTKTDKKGRPQLTFDLDTPTGQLLKRNLESSKSEFLFDTTDDAFTQAFNKHVGTKLEKFSDILPVADVKVEGPGGVELVQKPVTTPSAIRSIVPNIMLEQFNIPDALVQGAMGHVNSTILRKNYAGFSPSTDLPKLLENPSSFAKGNFGVTEKNINLDLLSDEDREAIAKEQKATLLAEDEARRATAVATIAEQEAAAVKAKAAVTPEDIAKAEQVEEEMVRAKERRRIREQEIRAEERAKARGEAPSGAGKPTYSPEVLERMEKSGLYSADEIEAFKSQNIFKTLGTLFAGTAVGTAVLGMISDPAATAAEIGTEAALLAAKVPAGVAGAVPMAMQPKEMGVATLQPGEEPEMLKPEGQQRMEAVVQKDVEIPFIEQRQREVEAGLSDRQEQGFAKPRL